MSMIHSFGNPAISKRPVALRLRLAAGLPCFRRDRETLCPSAPYLSSSASLIDDLSENDRGVHSTQSIPLDFRRGLVMTGAKSHTDEGASGRDEEGCDDDGSVDSFRVPWRSLVLR